MSHCSGKGFSNELGTLRYSPISLAVLEGSLQTLSIGKLAWEDNNIAITGWGW